MIYILKTITLLKEKNLAELNFKALVKQSVLLRLITLFSSFSVSFAFPILFSFELYGKFSYMISLLKIVTIFGGIGLSHYIIKNFKNNQLSSELIVLVLPYIVLGCMLSTLIVSLAIETAISPYILVLYALVTNITYCLISLLRISKSSYAASIVESFHGNLFILASVVICFFTFGQGATEILMILIYIALSISLIICMWFIIFEFHRQNFKFLFFKIKPAEIFTCIILASTFTGLAFLRNIDIIILGSHISESALGRFKIIAVIIYLPIMFHGTIETLIIPKLRSGEGRITYGEYRKISKKSFIFNLIFTAILLLGCYWFIEFIYEIRFSEVISYLLLGLIVSTFLSLFGFYTSVLNYGDHHWYMAKVMIGVNVLNLILNLFFIPMYFEFGAVLSTAVSMIMVSALSNRKVKSILC